MKFESQVVHAGDRKRNNGAYTGSTTPIHLGTTYLYNSAETLDRVLGNEEQGFSYSRYSNPTNSALEELTTQIEGGFGSLATSSGMGAIQIAIQAALLDRRHSILSSNAIYGATVKLFDDVFAPFDVDVSYVDICDLEAVAKAVEKSKPGCIFTESISNPKLRVPYLGKLAGIAKSAGAAFVVDSTFSTPMLLRPIEHGANLVVHSATKYLAGHGDVLGGIVVSDEEHLQAIRTLARVVGPGLGPFESYLTMRGIKTLALRFERQCKNAHALANWLRESPHVEKVFYCAGPDHPDAAAIRDQFAPGLFGAILSFEIKGADKPAVLRFMDRLRMIVPGTSLGDVHTLLLYPRIASHRDISPKMRERMGIPDNLVRIAAGIEAIEDIIGDLKQALCASA